ncbi:MAG: 50S ribosomal protein L21 [Bacillota bacterium]|nr:50S ribosomal protein L21 [Bacillota bacterium]MDI7250079.1 50S ribosomal protein L21 [Bacillota bacterium]
MYAIVETGGKQYRAEEGQVLVVEKLDAQPGDQVELPVVALVDEGRVVTEPGARVTARVLDHFKGRKIIVFKYRPKVNYRRKTGHRQQHTRLRVESIQPPA